MMEEGEQSTNVRFMKVSRIKFHPYMMETTPTFETIVPVNFVSRNFDFL